MDTTKLIGLLAGLALAIAVSGAASANGGENEVEQDDNDAYTDQEDVISNDNDFDFYGSGETYDENAWTGANCQLIVVADAWIGALSVTSALGVLDDSDTRDLLVGDLFPFQREGEWFDTDAESSTSSCDQSIGPVNIFVATDEGWDEPAPLGGTLAEAGEAAAMNRGGGTENEIEQEDSDADSYQSDIIKNDNYVDYEYLDESALASANCQAIIAAHVGVWSVSIASMDATLYDTDDSDTVIDDSPMNGVEPSSIDGDVQFTEDGLFANLTIDNDTTAFSSCAQPIESITISIGGRDNLTPQS